MSDPVEQPGAPTEAPTNIPPASEKSVAAKVQKEMPQKATSALATPDRILLRLNKCAQTQSLLTVPR